MHNHALYQAVTADCDCCKLPCRMWFTSADDPVICKGCLKHYQGDSPAQRGFRNREHVGLYWSELRISMEDRASDRREHEVEMRILEDRHSRKIEEMEAQLAAQAVELSDLRAVIRNGELNPAVHQWFADEAVREAQDSRDRAYRWRDAAFATLWGVAQVHRPDEHADGFCKCGSKEAKCRVLQAVLPELRVLDEWEDKQVLRLEDGLEHGLPPEHPEVRRLGGYHLRRRYFG